MSQNAKLLPMYQQKYIDFAPKIPESSKPLIFLPISIP